MMYPPYIQQVPNYLQNGSNSIIWVNGLEGAKAYQLPINGMALLMDSENDKTFYIKTSDNIGMSNIRTFKYTEVTTEVKKDIDMSRYVTREELIKTMKEVMGIEPATGTNGTSQTETESKFQQGNRPNKSERR